jgi:A/G-specific adenine glycosylase
MQEFQSDPQDDRRLFTRSLIRWYEANGRVLPWRQTADPYAIWVSEIMLQQTQVATVEAYYRRFLSAFPTVQDLAAAPLEKILKSWEGLGYYARARNLHRAAAEVVARFDGKIPPTLEAILSLPGIGRSTAGAILTIGLGQRHPIMDGNVRRVLCRYFAVLEDPKKKEIEKALWEHSERLLPEKKPDVYTQAIMDLGATVCTPASPRCERCPVQKGCRGYRLGVQADLPVKGIKKKVPHRDYVAGILFNKEKVLIRRRPLTGLLAGLWEFPAGPVEALAGRLNPEKEVEAFFEKEIGLTVRATHPWMEIKHTFTHFRMTLHVFICAAKGAGKVSPPLRWAALRELADHPFSAAHQKIVLKLAEMKGEKLF